MKTAATKALSIIKIFTSLISPLIAPLILLAVWQYASVKIENEVVLPPVAQVFDILLHPEKDLLSMGSLTSNVLMSTIRVMFGYLAGVILAVPLGILMGYYKKANRILNSLVEILRPLPPLAWIPLILAWFGVASFATIIGIEEGEWYVLLNNVKISMLIIIFIGAFFPVLLNTIQGVSCVKKTLIDSALVLGASERDIFCKILIPAAAPSIVTGMRLGLGVSWMCLVAAEMMPGSISGIGYIITHAYTLARTDIVIAGMISIGMIGLLIDVSFKKFENSRFAWQRLSK
ncbi:MAG: ABC transporter permease [Synergistaceae bacterium]|nr:ABC transporter permease [Synergistaceae bacterium]